MSKPTITVAIELANDRRTIPFDPGGNRVEFAKQIIDTIEEMQSPQPLRPMSEATTTGPVKEILAFTAERFAKGSPYFNQRWLVVHYAHGGGEEQPRFRGWFFWTGYDYQQIETSKLLGWIPLPEAPEPT